MKKVISIILCIMLVLSVAPISAFAVDTYDLWVGGVQVTSENASSITGEGISGTVTYDAATRTLTLDGATISKPYYYPDWGYNTGIFYDGNGDGLTVKVIGDCLISMDSDPFSGIICQDAINLTGSGKLRVAPASESGSVYYGIYANLDAYLNVGEFTVENSTRCTVYSSLEIVIDGGVVNATGDNAIFSDCRSVTINGGSVYAKAKTNGLRAANSIIIGSDVDEVIASATDGTAIYKYNYSEIPNRFKVADGLEIFVSNNPVGELHPYEYSGDLNNKWMKIAKPDPTAAKLWIGGMQINGSNRDNISAALNELYPGVSHGTATYTPATADSPAVLSLKGFYYNGGGATPRSTNVKAIIETQEDLIINNSSASFIQYKDELDESNCVLYSGKDCDVTITGTGAINFMGGDVTDDTYYGKPSSAMTLYGDLTVSGSVSVIAIAGDSMVPEDSANSGSCTSSGCQLSGNLTFSDSGSLLVSSGKANGRYNYCYGLSTAYDRDYVFNFTDSWSGYFIMSGKTSATKEYGNLTVEGQPITVTGFHSSGYEEDIGPEEYSFNEFSFCDSVEIRPYFERQPIYVQGVRVTEKNYSDVLGDGTVSYDKATNTLTLNNANIQSDGDKDFIPDISGIHYGVDKDYTNKHTLNIRAIGNNTVTAASVDSTYYTAAIATNYKNWHINFELVDGATLTLNGGSSKKSQHGSYGIFAEDSDIAISGKGTLNAVAGKAEYEDAWMKCIGINCYSLSVSGDVTVNAQGGSCISTSAGIMIQNGSEFRISDNAVINCKGGELLPSPYFPSGAKASAPNPISAGFCVYNGGYTPYKITMNISGWKGTMTCEGNTLCISPVFSYNDPTAEINVVSGTELKGDYLHFDSFSELTSAKPDASGYTQSPGLEGACKGYKKCVLQPYKGFPDVKEGSWYFDAVKYCAIKGFIGGYSNGKFGPADNLKRQDFVMILARIAGADLDAYANKTSKFSDVKKGAYYYSAVNWAVENGIIGGYSNGKFGVGDNITREQVATILYRYAGSPDVDNVDSTLAKFSDVKRISAYAKIPLTWAVQNGVISGMADGRVAPVEGASRSQIAVIIMRMDEQGMFNKA